MLLNQNQNQLQSHIQSQSPSKSHIQSQFKITSIKLLLIFTYLILVNNYQVFSQNSQNQQLQKARELYYKATLEEEHLENAVTEFENIKKNAIKNSDKKLQTLTEVYLGSLVALKGKYTMWPQKKFSFANEGIDIMEKAIEGNRDQLEAIFIYGSTCHYLPFFFGKKEDAKKALKQAVVLLENDYKKLDKFMVNNILKFITERIELTPQEKKIIDSIAQATNFNPKSVN